jgi:hypothetical protein
MSLCRLTTFICRSAPQHAPSTANWINSLTCRSASGPRADSQMGIDLNGQVIKLTPLLTKARRLVGRMQLFAILPLGVVDDAPTVEASMQADRLIDTKPGWRAMNRARSAISESASFCVAGSASIVICVTI